MQYLNNATTFQQAEACVAKRIMQNLALDTLQQIFLSGSLHSKHILLHIIDTFLVGIEIAKTAHLLLLSFLFSMILHAATQSTTLKLVKHAMIDEIRRSWTADRPQPTSLSGSHHSKHKS